MMAQFPQSILNTQICIEEQCASCSKGKIVLFLDMLLLFQVSYLVSFCKMQNSELHESTLKDQYSFESRMRNKSELKISKGFLRFPLTMTPTILVSLSTYCYITSGTY